MFFVRLVSAMVAVCAILLVNVPSAISATSFKGGDNITGADCCHEFNLIDHNGNRKTLSDFKGRVVLLSFGYTHCPDVCPTTLFDFSTLVKKLGGDAKAVQVLFITIDPERDTPDLLKKYVTSFDPNFLGLYGDLKQTASVAREFRIFYRKNTDTSGADYSIDHSVGVFVIDTNGKVREFVPNSARMDSLASDIQELLVKGN